MCLSLCGYLVSYLSIYSLPYDDVNLKLISFEGVVVFFF